MKIASSQILNILLILSVFLGEVACAQIQFKKGETYQRQVLTKSNCVLQRGGQSLQVSSYSTVVKTYKVTDASEKGASFTVTTDKLTDTVNSMNQKLIYNSSKPADPNSPIQTSLQKMVNAPFSVSVNSKAEITNFKRPVALNDTILSFAGIQPESLKLGDRPQFIISFPINLSLKKGYTWVDNTSAPSTETTYTVYATDSRTTTITYKTAVLGGNLNSRINGSMLIDNNTGIILRRYSQSVSIGYEMVEGIVYTATRRTAITETSIKK